MGRTWWKRKLWKLPMWAWAAVVVVVIAAVATSGGDDEAPAAEASATTNPATTTPPTTAPTSPMSTQAASVTQPSAPNDGDLLLSEAFCNDVKAGAGPINLKPSDMDPADFADSAYGMMAISCPEELEGWRAYFEQWDINIDA